MKKIICYISVLLASQQRVVHAFLTSWHRSSDPTIRNPTLTRRNNFFKDMFDKAFENDTNLSSEDKRKGQLDDDDDTPRSNPKTLTVTQEKWRQWNRATSTASPANQAFSMDLFITGVPNKDPSNDLYGNRVNISARDRQVGLTVPDEPTVEGIIVTFLPDNKCRCETSTPFTQENTMGDWKLSEDGQDIRFRIRCSGYTRTVETKGSIQSVFWSNEPNRVTETSTTYKIPAGWIYGEAKLRSNNRGTLQWEEGILKIEQESGLFGVTSKMIPCGKFRVSPVKSSSEP